MTINIFSIETLMAEQGLTKKALAEKSGMSAQNVSTIIRRGTCEPVTAGKLAAGLGVPVADILRNEAQPATSQNCTLHSSIMRAAERRHKPQ